MESSELLVQARVAAGLTQAELARLAGTSRPTLSAYESGSKSPTLGTAARLLAAAGFELAACPKVEFVEHRGPRGRSVWVPNRLPRPEVERALGSVVLPLQLNWSDPGRAFDLGSREDRARVYEIVLREGQPEDIRAYVDGVLLIDLWDELVLPRWIRNAWRSVVAAARTAAA